MAYRLGVDVGGTFTDLFLVDDADSRHWRVKTPSTPRDPSEGVLAGRAADLRRGRDRARRAGQRGARHDRRDERRARVARRARRADHDAGLRPDPAPRALADARAAGRLDHHGQARSAGLARRHARGRRADGRARRDARPRRPRAGQGRDRRPDRLGRRVADGLAHQRVRRRPPRARDRGPGRGAASRLPRDDLVRRAAGVPRVRAHADRMHELLRAPAGRRLRGPAAGVAARPGRAPPSSTSCARTPA